LAIVVYDEDEEEDVGVMDACPGEVEVEYEGQYDGEEELVPAKYEMNEVDGENGGRS